jgi:hypothetical protein
MYVYRCNTWSELIQEYLLLGSAEDLLRDISLLIITIKVYTVQEEPLSWCQENT